MSELILTADLTHVRVPGPPRKVRAPKARRQGDTYETPYPLALAICRRLRELGLEPGAILEPSAGFGRFVLAARDVWGKGPSIYTVEPRPECVAGLGPAGSTRHHGGTLESYHSEMLGLGFDLVIGNPPYSLAEQHIELLLSSMKDGAVLAFILRLPFLGGDRGGLLTRWIPTALWPIVPRPSFTDDGDTEKIEYGVFLWVKGKGDPRIFGRVSWEKEGAKP